MWPILFSFGFLTVRTSLVVLLLGFLVAGFAFWCRGKEEHYSEIQLFDGLVLSFLAGAVGARLGFIMLHFDQFGLNLFQWLDLVNSPGSLDLMFLVSATYFLYRFALRKKWDAFEVLDFWALSLSLWLMFSSLADFVAGTGRGKFTDLFIGVIFPGSIEKTHPTQLYFALFYLLLSRYLVWAESRYRIFEWYRMGRKSAQTGFLISNFLIFYSLFSLLMLLFRLPEFVIGSWSFDWLLYLAGMLVGVRILLRRSDKSFLPLSFKRRFERQDDEVLP